MPSPVSGSPRRPPRRVHVHNIHTHSHTCAHTYQHTHTTPLSLDSVLVHSPKVLVRGRRGRTRTYKYGQIQTDERRTDKTGHILEATVRRRLVTLPARDVWMIQVVVARWNDPRPQRAAPRGFTERPMSGDSEGDGTDVNPRPRSPYPPCQLGGRHGGETLLPPHETRPIGETSVD